MTWRELEAEAPTIARLGRERLEQARVALLGTIRRDGAPRISPIEPYFSQADLLLGAMSWSLKARDLLRDPRCVLHSAVTAPNKGEPELKLYGRAREVDDDVRDACEEGWWHASPRESAVVFSLDVERATLLTWDLRHGEMRVNRWSPERGYTTAARSYP